MTATWNPSDDFPQVVDAVQTVAHIARNGESTPVAGSLKRRVRQREAKASNGLYTREDVKWNLPARELPASPKVGESILDSQGQTWTILRVDQDTASTRWRCWCRRLDIAETLTERVHIQQAAWSKDGHGALTATWSNERTNIPARVQPLTANRTIQQGERLLEVTHRIYLEEEVEVDESKRILHPTTGEVYHILGYEQSENISGLLTLHAKKNS